MVEPPVAKKPNALGGAPSPAQTGIPWDRILPILPIVFAVPLNVGSWEVHTAFSSSSASAGPSSRPGSTSVD